MKTLQDIIESLANKENRTAAESKLLANALKQTGEAADRATAKAVLADAAIRRLGDDMKNVKPADVVVLTDKAAAKLNEIKAKAEELKARFPQYTVQINDKVAKAELDLFAAEAKRKLGGLDKQIAGTGTALSGLKVNPGLVGPLLALVPALGTLTGVVAGVGVGLAGAFVAGGGALAAFGAVAKPVLSDAMKASQAVEKAQNNYSIAIANGTKQSVAYKAEQIAIGKAYAGLSPAQIALSQQLGAMAKSWDAVKTAQTPVVAGALQPWLRSVTDLTGKLGPIIAAVGPVIGKLGTQFGALVNSAAFTRFRDFIANTGSKAVGAIGGTLIDFINAFIILLPKFNPLIEKATGWIGGLGPAVLKWAGSKKTADDITRFMDWFKTNGPVVGGLLTNIGGALKALAPGLTSGGAVELKVISDFFGLVAKLPASFAKPVTEVAGSLLILSKLGVLKVGVQVIGAAAKWLTGGIINLGGGAAAGAEIRAAMVSGGAAAAAEIRAAMAGGGAAGAAGGAAGAAKGALGGLSLGAFAGLAAAGAGIGAGFILAVRKAIESGWKGILGILPQLFGGVGGILNLSATGWTNAILDKFSTPVRKLWAALGHFLASSFDVTRAQVAGIADNLGKFVTGSFSTTRTQVTGIWNTLWNNTVTRAANGVKDVETWFANLRAGAVTAWTAIRTQVTSIWNTLWANTISRAASGAGTVTGWFNNLRAGAVRALNTAASGIAGIWNTIWANTISRVSSGVGTVVSWFAGLRGKITSAIGAAGSVLTSWGRGVINGLLSGMTSVINSVWTFIKGIPGKILSFLGIKSPPQWAIDAGKHIMNGLGIGMGQAQAKLKIDTSQFSASALAGSVGGGGAAGGSNAANQALGKRMAAAAGWTGAEWNALNSLIMGESGWSSTIMNTAGSGAAGIAQNIQGFGPGYERGNAAQQIAWLISYIKNRPGYGDPIRTYSFWLSQHPHWYAGGTSSALPGWAWVGERGPELLRFRGGEQVIPAHAAGGGGGDLAAELRALRAEVRQLNHTAAAIPAATGRHVGGAINSAAGSASFRSRYPAGGA